MLCLGDLGGAMGLWLGASILAAVQLLDYCAAACHTRCCSDTHSCKAGQVDSTDKVIAWDPSDEEKTEKIAAVWTTPATIDVGKSSTTLVTEWVSPDELQE